MLPGSTDTLSRSVYHASRKVDVMQEADVTSPHSNAGSSEPIFSFELYEHFLHVGALMTEAMNFSVNYNSERDNQQNWVSSAAMI